jgi:hypothetical protein
MATREEVEARALETFGDVGILLDALDVLPGELRAIELRRALMRAFIDGAIYGIDVADAAARAAYAIGTARQS